LQEALEKMKAEGGMGDLAADEGGEKKKKKKDKVRGVKNNQGRHDMAQQGVPTCSAHK
jgi:hypothetical protein